MLKGRLAARLPLPLLFLCLLSSVESDEGLAGTDYEGFPLLVSALKEMCLERLDPLSCQYWDSIRYKTTDSDSGNPSRQTPGKESTEDDVSFEIPVVEAENNFQKRFTVFRRKTSTGRGYKRGPGFRSWGGKRDLLPSGPNPVKRNKFASWGGKRNGEFFQEDLVSSDSYVKKPKFQNWGGKKSTDDFSEDSKDEMEKRGPIWKDRGLYLGEPFKKHVPKRPQFQSWGGKRTPNNWNKFLGFLYYPPRYLLNGGEKRKFSSWGGKRFDESEPQRAWTESKEENPKRNVFQNWGGKRATSDGNSNQKEGESEEKPTERKKRDVEADLGPRLPSEGGPKVWQSKR